MQRRHQTLLLARSVSKKTVILYFNYVSGSLLPMIHASQAVTTVAAAIHFPDLFLELSKYWAVE
jgi:hypothetical protein